MIIFKRKPYGFSVIEILITFVIASGMVLLSVQGISRYFQQRQQYVFMQQLYHDLKWARVEAIVLNEKVTVQPKQDWCAGWEILRANSRILKTHPGLKNCQIVFSSFPELMYFQFTPQGTSGYQNATFTFYDQSTISMQIVINQAGRVRWVS